MFHFYTPWKCQKMFDFPTFSGGIEKEHWTKMGQKSSTRETYLAPVWNAQFESK